ncbi:MAG: tetratricopeptide repeat protein [Chryseobacterium sp.]|nr:MAG: tetratricopeptide repeat protein [Chryseobacterium sp.]
MNQSYYKNIIIFAVFILLALIWAYANHFQNTFHFDDAHAVVDNVAIRNLKNLPKFFSDPKMFSADPQHWGLRPLVTSSLAIDYALGGGLNPFYFQLSTYIWHILLCILLYFIYRKIVRLSSNPWAAWVAAIASSWFALHTANAETLNYVISRSDVLSTFFILSAFGIYIFWPAKRKYYLYVIPAVIGVFAKETVPVLLVILFFYKLIFEEQVSLKDVYKSKQIKSALRVFVSLLPLTLAVLAVQLYTLSKIPSVPGITNPWLYYVLTQSYVWLHYFISFFFPTNLSADTDWAVIMNPLDERIILGVTFVVSLIIAIVRTSAKSDTKPISLGLIWFAASLLPTSLAPFAEVTNDHRMYFAFTGLALAVTAYLSQLIKKSSLPLSPFLKYGLAGVLVTIFGLNVYGIRKRNIIWNSEESLWYDVTIKSPNNGRGLMNYGLTQMAKGNFDSAEGYFKRALNLLPNYSTLYINLGVLYGAKQNHQEAEKNFKRAISLQTNAYESYTLYARYLLDRGRYPDAIQYGEEGLKLNPNSEMALNILLKAYNLEQNWIKLAERANNLLVLSPGDQMAKSYFRAAKNRQPLIAKTVVPKGKESPTAADHLNASLEAYNSGQYQKCIEHCQAALRMDPNYADAYSNMGAAYNQLGEWQKGIDACKKALLINPSHKLAKGNLDWAMGAINAKSK